MLCKYRGSEVTTYRIYTSKQLNAYNIVKLFYFSSVYSHSVIHAWNEWNCHTMWSEEFT